MKVKFGITWFLALYFMIMVSARISLSLDDVYEPNDIQTEARELVINNNASTYSSLVYNNDDWFFVTSSRNGYIHATIDFSHNSGDLQLELRDQFGALLGNSLTSKNEENVFTSVSAGDAVYIHIYNGGSDQYYNLTISYDDEYENIEGIENDTDLNPKELIFTAAKPSRVVITNPLYAMDDDYYYFTPTTTNEVVILVRSYDSDSSFAIDNVSGLSGLSARSGTGWVEVHGQTTASTDVNFRVIHQSGDNTKYYLRLYGDDNFSNNDMSTVDDVTVQITEIGRASCRERV